MEINYQFRKQKCRKIQKFDLKCNIQSDDFFRAYKCAENYKLKCHVNNHRTAIEMNAKENHKSRSYEFPHFMKEEIEGKLQYRNYF